MRILHSALARNNICASRSTPKGGPAPEGGPAGGGGRRSSRRCPPRRWGKDSDGAGQHVSWDASLRGGHKRFVVVATVSASVRPRNLGQVQLRWRTACYTGLRYPGQVHLIAVGGSVAIAPRSVNATGAERTHRTACLGKICATSGPTHPTPTSKPTHGPSWCHVTLSCGRGSIVAAGAAEFPRE